MNDLTIKELYKILEELIKDGYGAKRFEIFYDSETVYTTIPKQSRIFIFQRGVRFSDYIDHSIPEIRTIGGILEEIDDVEVKCDEEHSCGTCDYFQLDGMFGVWCEKDKDLYNDDCPYYKRVIK